MTDTELKNDNYNNGNDNGNDFIDDSYCSIITYA